MCSFIVILGSLVLHSIHLGIAYLNEIEIFFSESTVDKDKR